MTPSEEKLAKGLEQVAFVALQVRHAAMRLEQIEEHLGLEGLGLFRGVLLRLAEDMGKYRPGPAAQEKDVELLREAGRKGGIPDHIMQQVLSSTKPRHRG